MLETSASRDELYANAMALKLCELHICDTCLVERGDRTREVEEQIVDLAVGEKAEQLLAEWNRQSQEGAEEGDSEEEKDKGDDEDEDNEEEWREENVVE